MSGCIACLSTVLKPYSPQVWPIWGVDYSLVVCSDCGTIRTDPMPDDAVLARVYAECFDYRWYQDHYSAKIRDCRERVREYRPYLGKRVLDFGGGVGYLSATLREAGHESMTYDPFCRKDDTKQGRWDTVIALHVLEHANEPSRTISEMKDLLVAGGTLILAVPNAAGKGYRERGMAWVWAQPPLLHTIHFTAAGLISLLEANGFLVDRVSFAERWDANMYTDLEKVSIYSTIDRLWPRMPYNRYSIYRKGAAALSTITRFMGLRRSLRIFASADADCSELQIVARLAGNS